MTKVTTNRKRRAVHAVRGELRAVLLFVAIVWVVFAVSQFVPSLRAWGVIPRSSRGLIGILTMTFLHANWQHIASNTIPLLILLALLVGSKISSWKIVVSIILVGGCLLWGVGMQGNHIGASLLIYGLIAFLISSGLFFEKRPIPLVIAISVGCLYGFPLLTGVLPRISNPEHLSWDGHLCGEIAGVVVAYFLERRNVGRLSKQKIPAK